MLIPLSYNVRSLFVRKATTIATALGIGLVVFVLSSSLMLGQGIHNTLVSNGSTGRAIVIRKGSDTEMASGIDANVVSLIMAAPGVKRGNEGQALGTSDVVVVASLDKEGGEGFVSNVLIRGVQPAAFSVRPEVRIVDGRPAQPGTDEVIVGKGIRGNFKGTELGSSFDIKKNRPVKVVGVFESDGSSFESEVWADIETVRNAFGRGSSSSSATVMLDSPSSYDAFATYIENDKQLGLEPMRENVYYDKQSEGTSMFITVLGAIIAFFFSVGAMIGAMITMYGAVAQRSKEVGTLRALGFSRGAVLLSFLFESVVLALIGGVIGGIASMGMTAVKFSTMNFSTWQEISFSFDPSPAIVLGSIAAGGIMGILGGFFPAVAASRLSPIEAMRG
ncbi:MAG TPA: ABC transporter permease [Polyangiaceae bacterium]|nr:ABC transporter permease [Polyangiaceae bacterium]